MSNLNYVEYYLLKDDKRKIKSLYDYSFPIEERCPYVILLSKIKKKKAQFFAVYEDELFLGLIYNIVYRDIVYIYYLAIEEKLRGKGYGSKVLSDIKEMYKNKRLILMAETLDPNATNYQERVNRNKFYEKNGFIYQGYTVTEFGVVYDMLGTENPPVSKLEFKELIKSYFGMLSYHSVYKKNTDIEK